MSQQQSITDVVMTIDDPPSLRLLARQPRDGDRVTMVGRLDPSGHEIAIEVEHREAVYRVARVTINACEGDELTSAVLGMPVKETAERMLAYVWARAGDPVKHQDRERKFLQGQRRRWLHDDFLRQVAEVYQTAEREGARSLIEAVRTALGPAGYSTVQRWVAEARKRGFLPPARPPRSGEGRTDGR